MLVNTLAASTHFECFITTPHSWFFLICFFIVFLGPLWGIWVTLMGQAQQLQEQHYSFLQVSVVFSCVHTRIWPPVFNMRSNIDACSCTWGLYYEQHKKVGAERKIPCHTCDSNLRQYCTWLFSQTLYQLSYIYLPLWRTVLKTLNTLCPDCNTSWWNFHSLSGGLFG